MQRKQLLFVGLLLGLSLLFLHWPSFAVSAPAQEPHLPARSNQSPAVVLPDVQITVDLIVATGLSSPLQVTNAGDGSGRLFIVEQTGKIRVL